jgi:hypothetical protein
VYRQVLAAQVDANLAMVCGRALNSPILVVDIDGASGIAKAKELNLSSGAACWIQRTGSGSGRLHVAYFHEPVLELRRHVKAEGFALDLIVDGYALISPSITKGPYQWQKGHSPSDIPLAELDSPPRALIDWWLAQEKAPAPITPAGTGAGHKAWQLLKAPIPLHSRNDALTRIAGWLRLYHPLPVGLAMLVAFNQSNCVPPLPAEEVQQIAASVWKYPQRGVNGHPLAVVPSFQRGEAP